MGYIGRRIGLSQGRADAGDPSGSVTGGGIIDLFASGYFQREGNIYNDPGEPPSGITATGGSTQDYGNYRSHTFTASGSFQVTQLGDISNTIEYLVVAGGGGGGGTPDHIGAGGGGAGGTIVGGPTPVSVATYPVVIGGGGAGPPSYGSGVGGTNSE